MHNRADIFVICTRVFIDGKLLVVVAVDDLVRDVRVPASGFVAVESLHLKIRSQPGTIGTSLVLSTGR